MATAGDEQPELVALNERCAQQQVEAFLRVIREEYGIGLEAIGQVRDDLHWLRQYRQRIETASGFALRALVTAVTVGTVLAIWEGLKHLVGKS